MLYIVFDNKIERRWHVGEEMPLKDAEASSIQEIQADGDELDYIQNTFRNSNSSPTTYNIPMPNNKRVVRWFGDIAKTIVTNL